MHCVRCMGPTRPQDATFEFSGTKVVNVPADACEECGEMLFTVDVVRELLRIKAAGCSGDVDFNEVRQDLCD